jgi:hypothetical protein
LNWTADGLLRHTVYVGLREDKSATDVRREAAVGRLVGAVKRKGNVVAPVVENTNRETLEAFVRETVSNRVSLLCTDAYPGYEA